MRMKAGEVSDWLRQVAGRCDHRKAVPDDSYLVLRPGPNFDWLMGNPVPTQLLASTPELGLRSLCSRSGEPIFQARPMPEGTMHLRLLSLAGLLLVYPAHAQSFNCRYGRAPDEVAICQDARL